MKNCHAEHSYEGSFGQGLQLADAQHGLGIAADPDEFEKRRILFKGDVVVS